MHSNSALLLCAANCPWFLGSGLCLRKFHKKKWDGQVEPEKRPVLDGLVRRDPSACGIEQKPERYEVTQSHFSLYGSDSVVCFNDLFPIFYLY